MLKGVHQSQSWVRKKIPLSSLTSKELPSSWAPKNASIYIAIHMQGLAAVGVFLTWGNYNHVPTLFHFGCK